MNLNPTVIFQRSERHEGVRWIHIGLLRLLYGLMFFVLGKADLDRDSDAPGTVGAR